MASGASAQSDWTPDDPLLTWAATQRTRRRGRRASKLPKRRTVVEEEVARVAPHPVSEETRLWEAHPKVDKVRCGDGVAGFDTVACGGSMPSDVVDVVWWVWNRSEARTVGANLWMNKPPL